MSTQETTEIQTEDEADENEPVEQTACDQAVVWSGNLLLVVAILDVAFFTIWNFISPVFLAPDCVRCCIAQCITASTHV